jgi:hypothetical protein
MDENTKIVLQELICNLTWIILIVVTLISVKQIVITCIQKKTETTKLAASNRFQLDLLDKKSLLPGAESTKEELLKYAIEKTDDEKAKESYISTLTKLYDK